MLTEQVVKLLDQFHENTLTHKDIFELLNNMIDSIYRDIDNIIKEDNIDKLYDQLQYFLNMTKNIETTNAIHKFPEMTNKIEEINDKLSIRIEELSKDLDINQLVKYITLDDIKIMYTDTLYKILLLLNNETIGDKLNSLFEELKKIHKHLDERTFGTHLFKFLGLGMINIGEPILAQYYDNKNTKLEQILSYIKNVFSIVEDNRKFKHEYMYVNK